MKCALVCGAGGFIGGHLVRKLKEEGYIVKGVDLKKHGYVDLPADEFVVGDLRDPQFVEREIDRPFDEVYQLAADMGGAGFIFTGENDADIMHNSALINLNVVEKSVKIGVRKLFYSSSACIYPERNQLDPQNPNCSESSAYPADPDSEYGWEKLFSERFYLAACKNYGIEVRIARFHNIFGPQGSWNDGREKVPAAVCRKIAEADIGDSIEIWGDGMQTRSFLFIEECLDGIFKLMNSDFIGPVNIGSDEMITINDLAFLTMEIAGKKLSIKNVSGPLGVRGRNSDNSLINEKLSWKPTLPLRYGISKTYRWISEQVSKSN